MLREGGCSIAEIAQKLHVAKSSVSLWVRDVTLSQIQTDELSGRPHTRAAVEKRRSVRLRNELQHREHIVDSAASEVAVLSNDQLFVLGIGLYWAEGAKTRRSIVQFTNSDARLIEVMMVFFKTFCDIPKAKYRGHIHIHEHLDAGRAREHWSRVSGIPKEQFFKTTVQHKRAEKIGKDSLPLGTFSIYICDTRLHLRILGWMRGLHKQTSMYGRQTS